MVQFPERAGISRVSDQRLEQGLGKLGVVINMRALGPSTVSKQQSAGHSEWL